MAKSKAPAVRIVRLRSVKAIRDLVAKYPYLEPFEAVLLRELKRDGYVKIIRGLEDLPPPDNRRPPAKPQTRTRRRVKSR